MLSQIFLGMSLVGAEWVLYLLILLSIISVALILERFRFYRKASHDLLSFRTQVRALVDQKKLSDAVSLCDARIQKSQHGCKDLESGISKTLIQSKIGGLESNDKLSELAMDELLRAKIYWDRNLSTLATIGSNAPFIGLFGTVLGIIKAFHDLSQQGTTGAQMVTAGISEALVATAVGLFVAIPAVIAYNLFSRRVKSSVAEAEALKSYIIGKLAS